MRNGRPGVRELQGGPRAGHQGLLRPPDQERTGQVYELLQPRRHGRLRLLPQVQVSERQGQVRPAEGRPGRLSVCPRFAQG